MNKNNYRVSKDFAIPQLYIKKEFIGGCDIVKRKKQPV